MNGIGMEFRLSPDCPKPYLILFTEKEWLVMRRIWEDTKYACPHPDEVNAQQARSLRSDPDGLANYWTYHRSNSRYEWIVGKCALRKFRSALAMLAEYFGVTSDVKFLRPLFKMKIDIKCCDLEDE